MNVYSEHQAPLRRSGALPKTQSTTDLVLLHSRVAVFSASNQMRYPPRCKHTGIALSDLQIYLSTAYNQNCMDALAPFTQPGICYIHQCYSCPSNVIQLKKIQIEQRVQKRYKKSAILSSES